jgi:hypothetical protein
MNGRADNLLPIPDFGTQTAQFMVGNVNILRNMPVEQAEEQGKNSADGDS